MNKIISTFSLCLIFMLGCSSANYAQTQTQQIDKAFLNELIANNEKYTTEGEVADYIPELGKANPNAIAIAVVDEKGNIIEAGDAEKKFTIQSISKLIGLMLAVEDLGEEEVFKTMGYYGTDQAFNHYANLETDGKPLNPMMNAGAILITSLIKGKGEEPYQRILERLRYITKNEDIEINEEVYLSEKSTGDRNRGIFHLLKSNELINVAEGDEEPLNNYFKQCSIEVTAADLAKIGYYFAHHCTRFDGNKKYKSTAMGELIQSQMLIAGMYDFSGEYARTVGLPSKSGVGGGIAVSIPNKMGIGTYNPSLDEHGNSVVGHKMILDMVNLLQLSLFH